MSKLHPLLLLLCATLTTAAALPSAATLEADRLLWEGHTDSAVAVLAIQAEKNPSATTRHDLAQMLLTRGDTAKAASIWRERCAQPGGERAFRAHCSLGRIALAQGSPDSALPHFILAAASCDEEWRFPILYEGTEAATLSGDSLQRTIFYADLLKRYGKFPGKHRLDSLIAANGGSVASAAALALDKQVSAPPVKKPAPPDSGWFLQVGAFAKKENAAKEAAAVGKKFPKLRQSVLDPLPGTTLFRAALGFFPTEDDALEAGRKFLTPAKVAFRVVKTVKK